MKYIGLILTILAFSFSGLAQTSDENALKSVVKTMVDAQTAYDAKTLDKILTPDYIEISPVGEFDPREKVLGFYTPKAKTAAAGMTATVTADEHSIRNYGKFAIVIVRLNYEMTANGKPLPPRSIRLTYAVKKEGNSWKIASAQYTGIRSSQPPKPQ